MKILPQVDPVETTEVDEGEAFDVVEMASPLDLPRQGPPTRILVIDSQGKSQKEVIACVIPLDATWGVHYVIDPTGIIYKCIDEDLQSSLSDDAISICLVAPPLTD